MLYQALLILALLVGMWVCEKQSLDSESARQTYLIGVLGAILGAKLWYGLQYGDFFSPGGMSFYGFGIGGVISVAIHHRWSHGRWAATDFPDAAATAIAAGVVFQRVGCFYQGCCFGKVCRLPWSVHYPPGSPAFQQQLEAGLIAPNATQSLPVHPTQVYEILAAVLALVVMLVLRRNCRRVPLLRYELLLGGTVYYSIYRFLAEYLRADSGGVHLGPFTFAQATSLATLVVALYFLIPRRLRYYRGETHLLLPPLEGSQSGSG